MAKSKTKARAQTLRKRAGEFDLPDEPVFETPISDVNDTRLINALNYYNYLDIRDKKDVLRKWLTDWAQTCPAFTTDEVKLLDKVEDWRITPGLAGLARLITRGVEFSTPILAGHIGRVKTVIQTYVSKLVPKKEPRPARDTTWEAYCDAKADLDDLWDNFYSTQVGFSAYAYLTEKNVNKAAVARLRDSFSRTLVDFLDLQAGDKDMKEAFPKLKRPQINKLVEQVQSIISDCDRYVSNQKAAVIRKPRKKKEKSAADQVKGLMYMKAFPDLKLVSVDPATMVGATSIWLYSTKYKTLRNLVGPGMTVKGSTVHGWVEDLSSAKALRKPDQILGAVLAATKLSIGKILPALTTKPQQVNGRVNADTVIVRVIR
jgi:hypothetical protein